MKKLITYTLKSIPSNEVLATLSFFDDATEQLQNEIKENTLNRIATEKKVSASLLYWE